jgi:hypothetical protein
MGVIHTGFIHDFANLNGVWRQTDAPSRAIGSELAGSDRLFIISSGPLLVSPGRLATEEDAGLTSNEFPRARNGGRNARAGGSGSARIRGTSFTLCPR